jgi:hypothetical protein
MLWQKSGLYGIGRVYILNEIYRFVDWEWTKTKDTKEWAFAMMINRIFNESLKSSPPVFDPTNIEKP